jgi:hypothetical protein
MFKLNRDRFDQIRASLTGYTTGELFSARNVFNSMKDYKIKMLELYMYLDDNSMSVDETNRLISEIESNPSYNKPCPDCGGVMKITGVNNSPGMMVGGGYKSVSWCIDSMGCGYEFYSKEFPGEMKARRMHDEGVRETTERLNSMRMHHSSLDSSRKQNIKWSNKAIGNDSDESGCSGCGKG